VPDRQMVPGVLGQDAPSTPPECAVCAKPIQPTQPFGGWHHADTVTVHGHVAQGPKRMTIAEFKAQREADRG
jgi:hypothetical protein